MQGAFETVVDGQRVRLLHDGESCFPVMLDAIGSAEREILFEMYWFGSDQIGRRFADALSTRARAGIRVRVIYDAVGSWEASDDQFEAMRAAGCEVHEFHPIAPWRARFRFGLVGTRTHRKLLVVDGRLGMTGGLNVADPWLPKSDGGEGWRDDMIVLEGSVVGGLRHAFLRLWQQCGYRLRGEVIPHRPGPRQGKIQVLANRGYGERLAIRHAYLTRIREAMRSIEITNSYFVPDLRIRRELADAVRRGVRVRVLVPGESDLPVVAHATRHLYGWLLRRGIEVHEWAPTILHAKSAVVDDRWCTVGTYNLDYLSWRRNLELNVAVEDESVAGALRARFDRDLESSVPVDLGAWRARSLGDRLAGRVFFYFRRFL